MRDGRRVFDARELWTAPILFAKEKVIKIDIEKTEFNAQASEQMHTFLRGKSWEEKIKSIERLRAAARSAREAMEARERSDSAAEGR